MTPASTGKFTTARVAVILFSASLIGGFVWYSQIKAQPAGAAIATEDASTRQMILPGSKRSNGAIVPDDIKLLENGVIDLNLESTTGQPSAAPDSKEGTILPSSKLGIFRGIVGSPGSAPKAEKGTSTPPSPVMISGSKSFAGPVFSASQTGILTIGKGDKETPAVRGPEAGKEGQPSGKAKEADVPAPAWNQNAPIFTSSKSGPVFQPIPQPSPPPATEQASKLQTPAPANKAATPAPASR